MAYRQPNRGLTAWTVCVLCMYAGFTLSRPAHAEYQESPPSTMPNPDVYANAPPASIDMNAAARYDRLYRQNQVIDAFQTLKDRTRSLDPNFFSQRIGQLSPQQFPADVAGAKAAVSNFFDQIRNDIQTQGAGKPDLQPMLDAANQVRDVVTRNFDGIDVSGTGRGVVEVMQKLGDRAVQNGGRLVTPLSSIRDEVPRQPDPNQPNLQQNPQLPPGLQDNPNVNPNQSPAQPQQPQPEQAAPAQPAPKSALNSPYANPYMNPYANPTPPQNVKPVPDSGSSSGGKSGGGGGSGGGSGGGGSGGGKGGGGSNSLSPLGQLGNLNSAPAPNFASATSPEVPGFGDSNPPPPKSKPPEDLFQTPPVPPLPAFAPPKGENNSIISSESDFFKSGRKNKAPSGPSTALDGIANSGASAQTNDPSGAGGASGLGGNAGIRGAPGGSGGSGSSADLGGVPNVGGPNAMGPGRKGSAGKIRSTSTTVAGGGGSGGEGGGASENLENLTVDGGGVAAGRVRPDLEAREIAGTDSREPNEPGLKGAFRVLRETTESLVRKKLLIKAENKEKGVRT